MTHPAETPPRKKRRRLVVCLAVAGALVGAFFACSKTMMYARPHATYVYLSIDDDPPGRYLQIYGLTFFGVTIYEQVGQWEKFSRISRALEWGLMLLFAIIGGAAGWTVGAKINHVLTRRSS